MTAPNTLILSHHDCDGIVSASTMSEVYPDYVVKFQEWGRFGVSKEDPIIVTAVRENPSIKRIVVLDLGCTNETLDALKEFSAMFEVILVDHHPPTDQASLKANLSPNFKIIHSRDNCTTGLAYEYAKALDHKMNDASLFLTATGIYADVASETDGGKKALAEIRAKTELPFVERLIWNPKTGREFPYSMSSLLGGAINSGRHVAYHYGGYVGFDAVNEMKEGGIDFAVELFPSPALTDYVKQARYPNLGLLMRWYRDWYEKRNEVFSAEYCRTYKFTDFILPIVNHPWDIAGYVSNVKSRNSKVPAIAINYGIPSNEVASLSARAGSSSTDLDVLMSILNESTKGKISGGGHPQAVGGKVDKDLDLKEVISNISEAFRAMRR